MLMNMSKATATKSRLPHKMSTTPHMGNPGASQDSAPFRVGTDGDDALGAPSPAAVAGDTVDAGGAEEPSAAAGLEATGPLVLPDFEETVAVDKDLDAVLVDVDARLAVAVTVGFGGGFAVRDVAAAAAAAVVVVVVRVLSEEVLKCEEADAVVSLTRVLLSVGEESAVVKESAIV